MATGRNQQTKEHAAITTEKQKCRFLEQTTCVTGNSQLGRITQSEGKM
jgi:hypothetical protein